MNEIKIDTTPTYRRSQKTDGSLTWLLILIIIPLWIIAADHIWMRIQMESAKAEIKKAMTELGNQ
jgi:hypothetical protein